MSHRDPSWPFRDDAALPPRLQRIKEQREAEQLKWPRRQAAAAVRAVWRHLMGGRS